MNVLEKEIEDIIWQSKWSEVRKRGLPISGYGLRQYDLGSYGIADIITVNIHKLRDKKHKHTKRALHITVYEIKKDQINISTFLQAARYVRAAQIIANDLPYIREVTYEIVLIGKTIETSSDFCFLSDVFKRVSFYTYSISLEDGIKFNKENGFCHTNEQLKSVSKTTLKKILLSQEIFMKDGL